MSPDRDPTTDELVAMAYADGELDSSSRSVFEERLAAEPALARQVAEYRALELLAREMAPPEPADHEWARLERDPLQRATNALGWGLFVAGAAGLVGWGLFALATADLAPVPKLLGLAGVTGVALLFAATVRARLRTLPLDPYRKVQR